MGSIPVGDSDIKPDIAHPLLGEKSLLTYKRPALCDGMLCFAKVRYGKHRPLQLHLTYTNVDRV